MKPIFKYFTYFISVSIALLLVSCEKNLKMELPTNEKPQLTIYGFMYAQHPTILMISRSIPITERNEYEAFTIDEAVVSYYINGELKETQKVRRSDGLDNLTNADINFIKTPKGLLSLQHIYYKSQVTPQPGDVVRIEVESPNLPMATFEGTLPSIPEVSNIRIEKVNGNSKAILGLEKFAEDLQTNFYWGARNFNLNFEDIFIPSLYDYVEDEAYEKVTFSLKFTEPNQFFSIGVPKRLNIAMRGQEPYIDNWEWAKREILDQNLFLVEQLIDIDNCVYFSQKSRLIAKQKKNPDRKGNQYFLPYLSSMGRQAGETIDIEVILPIMKEREYPSQLDTKRKLAIYALSSEFSHFAESGYGILEEKGETDNITNIELGEISAELAIARKNFQGGNGVLYLATPYFIQLP